MPGLLLVCIGQFELKTSAALRKLAKAGLTAKTRRTRWGIRNVECRMENEE